MRTVRSGTPSSPQGHPLMRIKGPGTTSSRRGGATGVRRFRVVEVRTYGRSRVVTVKNRQCEKDKRGKNGKKLDSRETKTEVKE